ncbi:S1C family serine protease [Papillibacter cinnamivorans]|uniref:S-layer homology domain-containing protein n=1 Tax=Papillibacter cinnamivorans DSM 12816 TaxID=1122930 RepID=A0A1W2CKM3_9FIRM|nr:S1C family serine protease [Papillibacter cinnamivorans]SMC85779.1 S-layer homology domain-containing protein [Papillibacter cinnamivorans DSM 12816]
MKKRMSMALVVILIVCMFSPSALAANLKSVQSADALYTLGLFKGTGTDEAGNPIFALDRTPTREEAVTMLVRLLGKEDEALSGNWTHPFTDVDAWAAPYVSYAYVMGLTKGTGSTTFGSAVQVNAAQYLTFVLRALGYSDSAGDFSWDTASVLSDEIGLTSGEYTQGDSFTRGDIASISFGALSQKLKGSTTTLTQSLLTAGAVTEEAVNSAGLSGALNAGSGALKTLSSEEIYTKCAPAVFRIVVYDAAGTALGTASGFFISSSGIAVTNYHVIDGAASALVYVPGKTEPYQVKGVYDYNTSTDLAVLQVDGDGFPYLETESTVEPQGGATVYAIGYPLGLNSTISQGIVSNPDQTVDGKEYIQTTAPISAGSSGGALINAYGRVIGVTSGTISDGQNLNFAVPAANLGTLSLESVRTLQAVIQEQNALRAQITLGVSPSSLALQIGQEGTVRITTNTDDDDISLEYSISDEYVAMGQWGDWVDDYSCELHIIGMSEGSATVKVRFADDTGNPDALVVFTVTVSSGAVPVSTYSMIPGAPDFGSYIGVALHKMTQSDASSGVENGVIYTYLADDVYNIVGDDNSFFYGYYALLEAAGYSYVGGQQSSSGYVVMMFKNQEYNKTLYYGMAEDDDGSVVFFIMAYDSQ